MDFDNFVDELNEEVGEAADAAERFFLPVLGGLLGFFLFAGGIIEILKIAA